MRAIIVCYLTLLLLAAGLAGAGIAYLHQQQADNAGVAAYQQQFSDYAKAAGAYK